MARRWVVNASPLIVLSKIRYVTLLAEMATELVIPTRVVEEIAAGFPQDAARLWLTGEGAAYIRETAPLEPLVAAWDLGNGENAVLSWAYRNAGFEAILDDRAARNCADTLRLPVRGTLGVILLAKQEGRIEKVAPVFVQLQEAGLRIDGPVLAKALQLAGE